MQTNALPLWKLFLYFQKKRDAMDIYVIDRTILECDEIVLPPASSTGNDNFGENIPNHDLLSTDADIETIYILLSLKLHLLCEQRKSGSSGNK